MDIHARQVSVDGTTGVLLPATSLRVGDGELALVGRAEHDATAFAMVLSGRMEPTTGAVLLDGYSAPAELRAMTAVVDAPEVTAPDPELPLAAVVAEELALAHRSADRAAVTDFLRSYNAEDRGRHRFDRVSPALRTELLTDIAASRSGVRMLVLDTPDRHTGDPRAWWSVASEHARRGMAVVVLCADATATRLGVRPATLGALQQPAPLRVPDSEDDAPTTLLNGATEAWSGELPDLVEENR